MGKTHPFLVIVGVFLSLGWIDSVPARQDCCHRSPANSGSPTAPVPTQANPMSSLNADGMRKEFNASSQKVRVVALLSPTCPGCRSGHAVLARTLRKFSSPKLQAIFVWEPMRDGDNPASATQQAETVEDLRISQGWDGSRNLGKLFGQTLGLHEIAWDVYLVYKPGIKWEEPQPPHPTFWMHQLEGIDPNLLLCADPTRLSAEVAKLLGDSGEAGDGK